MLYDTISKTYYFIIGILFIMSFQRAWIRLISLCIVLWILKHITYKERPDKTDFNSFPSGHTAVAWFFVAIFQWNPLIFVWAIIVSITRIHEKRHDRFDVIAGGLLGLLLANLQVE